MGRKRHFGNYRCEDGRAMRHDPQPDDPYLETDVGPCEKCDGQGCDVMAENEAHHEEV